MKYEWVGSQWHRRDYPKSTVVRDLLHDLMTKHKHSDKPKFRITRKASTFAAIALAPFIYVSPMIAHTFTVIATIVRKDV